MHTFLLDPRLVADCHSLGVLSDAEVLLMDNAHYPWLILVPHTSHTEFYNLSMDQQQALLLNMNSLSKFIKQHFSSEKLNIATIGNIVSQLHIHIIGRHAKDVSWPSVVWGSTMHKVYTSAEVEHIKSALTLHLGAEFSVTSADR